MQNLSIQLAEKGLLPDALIRYGIRQRLKNKLELLQNSPRSTAEWIKALWMGFALRSTEFSVMEVISTSIGQWS